MGVLDTLAAVRPNRRTVSIIIDGALQDEHAALGDQLAETAERTSETADDFVARVDGLVGQLEAVRDKIAASRVTFILESLPWTDRVDLQAAHPPREHNLSDRLRGYNSITFPVALLRASTITVVDADGDKADEVPPETWAALVGDDDVDPPVRGALSFSAVSELTAAAFAVNDQESAVPDSAAHLLSTTTGKDAA